MEKWIAGFAVVCIAACAPVTVDKVRSKPAGTVAFKVDQDYKTVFDVILSQTRSCFLSRHSRKELVVSDSRDIQNRKGNVTVSLIYGPTATETYLTTDVEAGKEGGALVTTYFSSRRTRKEAAMVQKWVTNGSKECAP